MFSDNRIQQYQTTTPLCHHVTVPYHFSCVTVPKNKTTPDKLTQRQQMIKIRKQIAIILIPDALLVTGESIDLMKQITAFVALVLI